MAITLTLKPGDTAQGIAVDSPIQVVGVSDGAPFVLNRIYLVVDGRVAYDAARFSRPDFGGHLTVSADRKAFLLTVVPRRSWLYRVKVILNALADDGAVFEFATGTFETAPEGVPADVTALYQARAALPSEPLGISLVRNRLRTLLEKQTPGSYYGNALYRAWRSSSWPAVASLPGVATDLLAAQQIPRGDLMFSEEALSRMLGVMDVLWEEGLRSLGQQGVSEELVALLRQSYLAPNNHERLGAVCAAVLVSSVIAQQQASDSEFTPASLPGLL